jgi:hypothetical protein
MTARPQFGIRGLFALTLLLAIALGIGKWTGLAETQLITGALMLLPSIWLATVALSGLARDVAVMSRRQRIVHGLLLLGAVLATMLAGWLLVSLLTSDSG